MTNNYLNSINSDIKNLENNIISLKLLKSEIKKAVKNYNIQDGGNAETINQQKYTMNKKIELCVQINKRVKYLHSKLNLSN